MLGRWRIRVYLIQDTINIPPWSCHHVTVSIPKADTLADSGLIIPSRSLLKSKDVSLVDGIVDTSGSLVTVKMLNLDATIYSGTPVGTCESFYDKEYADGVNFATSTKDVTNQPPSKVLDNRCLMLDKPVATCMGNSCSPGCR